MQPPAPTKQGIGGSSAQAGIVLLTKSMRKLAAAAALVAAAGVTAGVAVTAGAPVGPVVVHLRQTPVTPARTAARAPVRAPAAAVGARVTAVAWNLAQTTIRVYMCIFVCGVQACMRQWRHLQRQWERE